MDGQDAQDEGGEMGEGKAQEGNMDGQDEGGEVGEVKEKRSKRKDEAEAEVIAGTEVRCAW